MLFFHPDRKHHEDKSPFNFSEVRPFYNVYSVDNYNSNQTIPPSRTSRRSDYPPSLKLSYKHLSELTEEELAIINAVNLDDYPELQKDRYIQHLTSLYQAGWFPKSFSLETYKKWYAYFFSTPDKYPSGIQSAQISPLFLGGCLPHEI